VGRCRVAVTVSLKGWVGLVLMAIGILWGAALTWRPAPAPAEEGVPRSVNPIVAIIEALAKLAEALATMLGTRFGAPMLVFVVGAGLFIWDLAD
jgi:hypothetical protein